MAVIENPYVSHDLLIDKKLSLRVNVGWGVVGGP